MKMSRIAVVSGILIWVFAGLQQGLSFRLSLLGAQPDFILILVCILGLFADFRLALLIGFFAGVAQSAVTGTDMWQFVVTRMLACWLCALLVENRFQRNIGVGSVATIASTVICGLLFVIIAPQPNIGGMLKATIITAVYNGVLALLAYFPIERALGIRGQQL